MSEPFKLQRLVDAKASSVYEQALSRAEKKHL